MSTKKYILANANQAAARIAYKTNELNVIYPITPASEMSELVEQWSAEKRTNIYGSVPAVVEMQSEAGVAGTLHGALQTGSLATTFTASQGLLLMLPNMYKIAGELTPNVIHVATRSVATHALSVFGDHSDIMAARQTGYAFLGAASVQEAQDFALIAQAATLASRIPFVHFFDGFRTSHEISKIEEISDEMIGSMIDRQVIKKHRDRALSPDSPVLRGTSQGADVFFQSREASNPFYNRCPAIVQEQMDKFYQMTGRSYRLFDYVGHPAAERIIVSMASSTETVEQTVTHLMARGEKVGLVKVRLYRPFSVEHFITAIPSSCEAIAVLDRTKEPGASGEPLYLDVLHAVHRRSAHFEGSPKILGGRYGLSSKEFTPAMAKAVFDNLNSECRKNSFTVGIQDDLTHLSLSVDHQELAEKFGCQAIFYQTKSETNTASFRNILEMLSEKAFVQGYTTCDYKKTDSRSVSHLRLHYTPVKAPYLITEADFIVCDNIRYLESDDALTRLKIGGGLLVQTSLDAISFWKNLSAEKQQQIRAKNISLYVVNPAVLAKKYAIGQSEVSGMHACFLAIRDEWLDEDDISELRQYVSQVETSAETREVLRNAMAPNDFSETLLGKLLAGKGGEVPVSGLPPDGTFLTDTAEFSPVFAGAELPVWNAELCTQCGACSMACPQAAIRAKAYPEEYLQSSPEGFRSVSLLEPGWAEDLLQYTLQINPDQCNSCGNCIEACPAKALNMTAKTKMAKKEQENWNYFKSIPEMDRSKIAVSSVSQQQFQEPLFKYAKGVTGCGEAPYLKLLSQLFGDRMLIANATGASSIFGGALPVTPWSQNAEGRGPAWSNSLFEDNAEFGLGFRLSLDSQRERVRDLVRKMEKLLPTSLIEGLLNAPQESEAEIAKQRNRVAELKSLVRRWDSVDAQEVSDLADAFVSKSVWIVGGDGWAYDIGYGGLDHVLASGANVNILVLDNEVYSNTGGQMSKATPLGASARFAHHGKKRQKKDLGRLAMTYEDVYVASVAIGADREHTLKTLLEAESFEGPSLVIAYCHSPSHGIDMRNPQKYHKAAVASGQWPLYRRDPRRVLAESNPFQLDSPAPKLPIREYLKMEDRFYKFTAQSEADPKALSDHQDYILKRYELLRYEAMGTSFQNHEKEEKYQITAV